MNRSGKVKLSTLLLVALIAWGGFIGVKTAGVFFRKAEVEEIVTRIAFDWRDRNMTRAQGLMVRELSKAGLEELIPYDPAAPANSQCEFFERNPDEKHVRCWWWDYVKIPLPPGFEEKWHEFEFEVHLYLDSTETLWEWEE